MNNIRILLSNEPHPELIEKLEDVYKKIKQNFWLGKDEECIEKIGKFVEITTRVIEYITTKTFTPFSEELRVSNKLKQFENLPKNKFPESIRIMIPRVLYSLYTFRSKRGGAHVKEINPNHIDATYVVSACDWVMAELIRLYHTGNDEEIKGIINSLVEKKLPIIEEFGEDLKILDPALSVFNKILIILYEKHPYYVSEENLKKWIKTKTASHITTVLSQLDNKGLIYRKEKECKITKKGIAYVEEKFKEKVW